MREIAINQRERDDYIHRMLEKETIFAKTMETYRVVVQNYQYEGIS
jgi:hypothetical protein